MKKVLSIILPIILIIALCYYFFGSEEEYDFLNNINKISQFGWSNPIDTITSLFEQFRSLGQLDWANNFFGSLSSLPNLIVSIVMAPINMIIAIFQDIMNILRALLTMLGFNVNF